MRWLPRLDLGEDIDEEIVCLSSRSWKTVKGEMRLRCQTLDRCGQEDEAKHLVKLLMVVSGLA